MKRYIWTRAFRGYSGLLILFVAIALTMKASDMLDQQISVANYQDLAKVGNLLRSSGHAADASLFSEAVTYISTYADAGCLPNVSSDEARKLLVSIANNRTPRQIIVIGHMIQLERMKLALALEEGGHNGGEKNVAGIRRDLAIANANAAVQVIRRYLELAPSSP